MDTTRTIDADSVHPEVSITARYVVCVVCRHGFTIMHRSAFLISRNYEKVRAVTVVECILICP